jgi:hypothetical protein
MQPIYAEFRSRYPAGHVELVTNRAPQATTAERPGGLDPEGPPDFGYRAFGAAGGTSSLIGPYQSSVDEGVRNAVRDLLTLHERCPHSQMLIMGYSEGADVTRRALAALPWTPGPGAAFTMIFGDVLWRADDPGVIQSGDATPAGKGLIRAARDGAAIPLVNGAEIPPIPDFPDGWNVTSWCHHDDLACQWPSPSTAGHLDYHSRESLHAVDTAVHALNTGKR